MSLQISAYQFINFQSVRIDVFIIYLRHPGYYFVWNTHKNVLIVFRFLLFASSSPVLLTWKNSVWGKFHFCLNIVKALYVMCYCLLLGKNKCYVNVLVLTLQSQPHSPLFNSSPVHVTYLLSSEYMDPPLYVNPYQSCYIGRRVGE